MKFLTRLIACFLIAWLPIIGYPAQAPICSGMSTAISASHEYQSVTAGSPSREDGTKAPCAKLETVCQAGMNSLFCGAPGALISSHQAIAAVAHLPDYRPVSHTFNAQFIPEPPQRPPQSA